MARSERFFDRMAWDESLFQFGLRSFVTLIVVVDPLGVAPSFGVLTMELATAERRKTLARALIIALAVTLFFLFGGGLLLSYLGVTVHAFAISGGILLFGASWPMLFGQRAGLQSPVRNEQSAMGEDPAIFPLAIPLLSGPGTITTVLPLTNQAAGNIPRMGVLAATVAVVYIIACGILYTAAHRKVRRRQSSDYHQSPGHCACSSCRAIRLERAVGVLRFFDRAPAIAAQCA